MPAVAVTHAASEGRESHVALATLWHNHAVRFLRMKSGHGEVVIAEGDIEIAAEEELLVREFRRQIDAGLWAAVPTTDTSGQRGAQMVKTFEDIPRDADRVIFVPRAAGG